MKDITQNFGKLFHPVKAFLIYQDNTMDKNIYVESYDMDKNGFPINAHPLSLAESSALASSLNTSQGLRQSFLMTQGLLPKNVLYINPENSGFALWYTPAQMSDLLFVESLGIPNGRASLPPLLWKASKTTLWVYAIDCDKNITQETLLFHAPFFNLYHDGKVCMGTVKIDIGRDCRLEEFIEKWEKYFFDSYFSHLLQSKSQVKGNIIQLWKNLVNTKKKFPTDRLVKNGLTLKNLIS